MSNSLVNENQIVVDRARLEKLLRIAAYYDGEAAYLGGGGTRPGYDDWKVLASFQQELGIENEDPKTYHGALWYRDPVQEKLQAVDQIVSVGSIDGILTSASLVNIIGHEVEIEFTQAFEVNAIDPTIWLANRKVAFVDLAVNNRDKNMTADFVALVRAAGHQIVAVIDEHDRADWLEALGTFEGLIVEPQSQKGGVFTSSAKVLEKALMRDNYGLIHELLGAANSADQMKFWGIGEIVNKAIKPAIKDNARRIYLAQHFAFSAVPDETISHWVSEYDATFGQTHQEILSSKVDLGDKIVRVVTTGRDVDMTVLMKSLYDSGARVVVLEGEQWAGPQKGKILQVSYGTDEKDLDLMSVIRAAGIAPLGGFTNKVNCDHADEVKATAAVRAALLK